MVKQLYEYITIENIICVAGILLFAGWLLKTSFGMKALRDSLPRRNCMPFYLPFVPLFIWVAAGAIAVVITRNLLPGLETGEAAGKVQTWQGVFWENILLCLISLVTMAVIVFLVRVTFEQGLKGFGLNPRKIHVDFLSAVVSLLSVWPILLMAIILTSFFGRLIWGQQYEIERHVQLKVITAYPQLPARVIVAVVAVVFVPALEEMLFRGLFQTMIRSYIESARLAPASLSTSVEVETIHEVVPTGGFKSAAWISIGITSLLFATTHQNMGHWPALFILGVCLGYAYEKSGSLFRPIFIHCLFNGITIAAALA